MLDLKIGADTCLSKAVKVVVGVDTNETDAAKLCTIIIIGKRNKKGAFANQDLLENVQLKDPGQKKSGTSSTLPMNVVNQFRGKNANGSPIVYTAEHLDKGLTANN